MTNLREMTEIPDVPDSATEPTSDTQPEPSLTMMFPRTPPAQPALFDPTVTFDPWSMPASSWTVPASPWTTPASSTMSPPSTFVSAPPILVRVPRARRRQNLGGPSDECRPNKRKGDLTTSTQRGSPMKKVKELKEGQGLEKGKTQAQAKNISEKPQDAWEKIAESAATTVMSDLAMNTGPLSSNNAKAIVDEVGNVSDAMNPIPDTTIFNVDYVPEMWEAVDWAALEADLSRETWNLEATQVYNTQSRSGLAQAYFPPTNDGQLTLPINTPQTVLQMSPNDTIPQAQSVVAHDLEPAVITQTTSSSLQAPIPQAVNYSNFRFAQYPDNDPIQRCARGRAQRAIPAPTQNTPAIPHSAPGVFSAGHGPYAPTAAQRFVPHFPTLWPSIPYVGQNYSFLPNLYQPRPTHTSDPFVTGILPPDPYAYHYGNQQPLAQPSGSQVYQYSGMFTNGTIYSRPLNSDESINSMTVPANNHHNQTSINQSQTVLPERPARRNPQA